MWEHFRSRLDVLEAMGRRLAPGSPTEPLRQFDKQLGKGGPLGSAIARGAFPMKWLGAATDIYRGWQYGRNGEALTAMLTRPDAPVRSRGSPGIRLASQPRREWRLRI